MDFAVKTQKTLFGKKISKTLTRGESMKLRLVAGVVGALAASLAQAQGTTTTLSPIAGCDKNDCAYVLSATGPENNNVVKSGYLLCWRTGYWTPARAINLARMPLETGSPPAPPRSHRSIELPTSRTSRASARSFGRSTRCWNWPPGPECTPECCWSPEPG